MNASGERIRKILVSIAQSNTPPSKGHYIAYPVASFDKMHDKAWRARRGCTKPVWIAFGENVAVVSALSGSLLALNFGLLTAIIMFGSIFSIVLAGMCAVTAGAIVGWHIGVGLAKLKRPDLYPKHLRASST